MLVPPRGLPSLDLLLGCINSPPRSVYSLGKLSARPACSTCRTPWPDRHNQQHWQAHTDATRHSGGPLRGGRECAAETGSLEGKCDWFLEHRLWAAASQVAGSGLRRDRHRAVALRGREVATRNLRGDRGGDYSIEPMCIGGLTGVPFSSSKMT